MWRRNSFLQAISLNMVLRRDYAFHSCFVVPPHETGFCGGTECRDGPDWEIKSSSDKDYKMDPDSCLWGSLTPAITPNYEQRRRKGKDVILNRASSHMLEPLAGTRAASDITVWCLQCIHTSVTWSSRLLVGSQRPAGQVWSKEDLSVCRSI